MKLLKQVFTWGFLGILSSCQQNASPRGTLLSATPVGVFSKEALGEKFKNYAITARSGVTVFKLVYQTELPTVPPTPHQASGIVVIPDGEHQVYPWISLQHGTITGKVDAPSVSLEEGLLEGSQGFLTVVQDYIGFGEASDVFHPYMVAESYVDSGIDMLRAARSFAQKNKLNLGPLFLRGYSEGGYGTMVLQKALETDPSGEFKAVASAPGAGPYDLVVTSRVLGSRPRVNPVNLPFVLLSFNRWYGADQWDLSQMLNIDVSWAYELFSGTYRTQELFSILPWETTRLFKAAFVSDAISTEPSTRDAKTLHQWLGEQSLTNKSWSPSTPTKLYHCIDDTAVPVEATLAAYESFKAINPNAPVETVLIEIHDPSQPYDHMSCPGFYTSLTWFNEILSQQNFN
jgi:hypothetical protein